MDYAAGILFYFTLNIQTMAMVRWHFQFIGFLENVNFFFAHSSVSRPCLHLSAAGWFDITNACDILILLCYIIQITFHHICDEFVYPWTEEKKVWQHASGRVRFKYIKQVVYQQGMVLNNVYIAATKPKCYMYSVAKMKNMNKLEFLKCFIISVLVRWERKDERYLESDFSHPYKYFVHWTQVSYAIWI